MNQAISFKLKKLIQKTLAYLVTLTLIFPSYLFAAQIKIDTAINLRVDSAGKRGTSTLKPLTTLSRGTILEIPDEFVIQYGGKINANATINNWINKNHMRMTKVDSHGRPLYDYFFRVKVVKTNNHDFNGQYGFVALKTIAQKGGIKLVVTKPTPLYHPKSFASGSNASYSKHSTSAFLNKKFSSTEAKVCLGNCGEDSSLIQKVKSQLSAMLEQTKNRTNQVMSGKRPEKDFNTVIRNFENSCFGVKFDDFANFVKAKAPEQNIPAETMLSIMTQESAGKCGAIGDKTSSSKSVGLFQISTKTIRDISACTSYQMNALRGKTLSEMATTRSLRCLQNPAVNLESGMKVLRDKYRLVNNGALPTSKATWNDLSDQERDNFRKALSAYNGGEKWVQQSQSDIQYAAQKFGIKLDNSWENIRLFFFRHQLAQNGLVDRYGSTRATKNNLINVPYVEAILGRDSHGSSQNGYTQLWAKALYEAPANLVASAKN